MACAELMVTLALDRRFWVARKDSDGVKVPRDTWRLRKDGAAEGTAARSGSSRNVFQRITVRSCSSQDPLRAFMAAHCTLAACLRQSSRLGALPHERDARAHIPGLILDVRCIATVS